jgi:Ca2+-binding EF-hand superfamily protein
MGSAVSASSVHLPEWMSLFHSMKLDHHEVKTFYEVFRSVPIDDHDRICVTQLLDSLDVGHSMFAERMFAAFDNTNTGKVDFFEFVVSLWKFCALGDDSIGKFSAPPQSLSKVNDLPC